MLLGVESLIIRTGTTRKRFLARVPLARVPCTGVWMKDVLSPQVLCISFLKNFCVTFMKARLCLCACHCGIEPSARFLGERLYLPWFSFVFFATARLLFYGTWLILRIKQVPRVSTGAARVHGERTSVRLCDVWAAVFAAKCGCGAVATRRVQRCYQRRRIGAVL